MRGYRFSVAALIVAIGALAPADASAQFEQTRSGFWFNIGVGYGSLGCQDCSGREGGASGTLSLGGTLGSRWLLGVGVNSWTKSEGDGRLTASTVTATARFYPATGSGFFLLGGVGVGSLDVSVEYQGLNFSAGTTGGGAVLGLGWDLRIGNNVSITPFWNGFGITLDNGDANVGQLGVGLTVH